jgi:uncharacterized protein YndB with AHSA1/START domain
MSGATLPSLTLTRRFKAPAAKIFKAWADGTALKRWFGPSDAMQVVVAEVDIRIGGRYRIVMEEASGERHRVGGIYREIEPDRKLVFTWAWESTPERQSLVTVLLQPIEGGTLLTLTHEQLADEPARDRHAHGWNGTLDRLERHLNGHASSAAA